MENIFSNISIKLAPNPRKIFLIDGIGALLSGLLLIFLIAPYEEIFGMPPDMSYQLTIPVWGFMVYSLSCYFLNLKNWKPFLSFIAIANFLYCCLTFCLIIIQFQTLSILGIAYFLGEIIVIFLLVSIEWSIIKKHDSLP
jgi:hypothetical protein